MQEYHSDQVFESLLRESLGGHAPPDLSKRIQAAWQAEKLTGRPAKAGGEFPPLSPSSQRTGQAKRPLVIAELVEPGTRKRPEDIVESKNSLNEVDVHSKPVHLAVNVATHSASELAPKATGEYARVDRMSTSEGNARGTTAETTWGNSGAWRTLLSLSAIGLIGLLGWSLFGRQLGGNSSREDTAIGTANAELGDGTELRDGVDRKSASGMLAVESPKRATGQPTPERLDVDDVPFGASSSDIAVLPTPVPSQGVPVSLLTDLEIVDAVNRSLAVMWNSLGVQPVAAIDEVALRERLVSRLRADSAEADSIALTGGDASIASFTRTKAFSDQLAAKLVSSWLARSAVEASDRQDIEAFVSQQVFNQGDFSQVVTQLLGGDLSQDGLSTKFVSSLAGNGNHMLVQRVGQHFLDANLACVRCHDGKSTVRSVGVASQSGYWSLVAALKGIDSKRGSQIVTDNQIELFSAKREPNAFYDLPDGRMRAARARLPDGSDWRQRDTNQPRRALAEWIAESPEFDRAVVNQIWQIVVGRPLVPQVDAIDLAGLQDRAALQSKLAEQFRASGHDVSKLFSWIASSNAFNRGAPMNAPDELRVATDETLNRIQLSQLVFAAAPYPKQYQGFEDNMAIALRLRTGSVDSTLAQPNTATSNGQPLNNLQSKGKQSSVLQAGSLFPVGFALSGERPSENQRNYVASLMKAERLSWEDRVQHVVLLNPTVTGNARVQYLAQTLLQKHNGDAMSALLDLLWAVENTL